MKKTYLVGAIVLIIAIVIIGFTGKDKGDIKIGGTFALTGSLAYIGSAEMHGIEMAIEDINKDGGINGRKIKLLAEDNGGDVKNAVSSVQKLISVNKADVIYSAFTHVTKAVTPIASEAKIPLLYSSSDRTVAEDNRYVFRDYFDNTDVGNALARSVIDNKYTEIKVLSEVNASCDQIITAFEKESAGKAVITKKELYQSAETDLRAHLTKLALKDDEAVLTCAFRHANILMKNMGELNLLGTQTFQVVAPFLPVANTPEIRELFSKNQTISSWYGFAERGNTDKQDKFIDRYTKKYGVVPGPDSAFTYDDTMVLRNVLEKCYSDKLDNECFEKEMLATDYDGVAGKLKFNDKRLSTRDTLLIQAKNGVWEKI